MAYTEEDVVAGAVDSTEEALERTLALGMDDA